MCGIVGVVRFDAYGCNYKEKEIFSDLLICNSVRGTDGTGVFIVNEENVVRTLKVGSHPFGLLHCDKWSKFFSPPVDTKFKKKEDRAIIGHNRLKTTGKNTTEHAHPHKSGHITLVHNGTLQPYSDLPNIKKLDVDTQALCVGIETLGIQEAIGKTHGSYAIVYFDEKAGTLNMLRNSERPLAMAVNKTYSRIFFASEPEMLKWILSRNHIHNSEFEIGMLKPDMLYTWNLNDLDMKPEMKEVEGAKIYVRHHNGFIPWDTGMETELIDPWEMADRYNEQHLKQIASHTEKKVVREFKKAGLKLHTLDTLFGIKKGDKIVFRVNDYVDENPEKETFVVSGAAKTLPDTIIRFRLEGIKAVETVFEHPDMIAIVRNIIEYPEADPKKGEDRYGIWVSHANLHIGGSSQQQYESQQHEKGNLPVLVK